jgi:signal transduction histidine kinase
VNKEMIAEMKHEIESGNYNEVKIIAADIASNEEKIIHHGQRADAIVKSMLQHSRKSTGVKELTDINALCDEYLRLSYHGLRAKDKSFNADFKMNFDNSVGKQNVVPQDIGRVLLNLFNNAFYAVNEKKKTAGTDYKPLVSVSTKKINNHIEIAVIDNGNGMPQNIIDKIFQPFFTTKPTGEGTGLGLSLSYDIITKEHNGTIKVQSKVDEENADNFRKGGGSTFIIHLPST